MTKAEIKERIECEYKHIENVKTQMLDLKFDIAATRKAIKMWKSMLCGSPCSRTRRID